MPIPIYKPVGYTPLEALEALRKYRRIALNERLSYAGRLDPQADGVLLVLIGDENKNRALYERLTKSYDFQILFGATSDTYDVMGMPTLQSDAQSINLTVLTKQLACYLGKWRQAYPPYSSVRINGKPLFYWARKQQLSSISIPSKSIFISTLQASGLISIDMKQLVKHIVQRIKITKGDFRQREIINQWNQLNKKNTRATLTLAICHVDGSNGLYVRSLVHQIGIDMKVGALAFTITRTRVGDYALNTALRIPSAHFRAKKGE